MERPKTPTVQERIGIVLVVLGLPVIVCAIQNPALFINFSHTLTALLFTPFPK